MFGDYLNLEVRFPDDHRYLHPFCQKQHWRTLLSHSASAYPSFLPPPGFLHTSDGGHLAPTLSRHSPPVFSAPWVGHRGGSAHPPGAHSHCAGKAVTTSSEKVLNTRDSPLTPSLLLTLLLIPFICNLPFPSLPHLIQGFHVLRQMSSYFQTFSYSQTYSCPSLSGIQWCAGTVLLFS